MSSGPAKYMLGLNFGYLAECSEIITEKFKMGLIFPRARLNFPERVPGHATNRNVQWLSAS